MDDGCAEAVPRNVIFMDVIVDLTGGIAHVACTLLPFETTRAIARRIKLVTMSEIE